MKTTLLSVLLLAVLSVQAQHEHHDMADSTMHDMQMTEMQMPGMSHSYSLSLPMSRNGSGTSWSPDNNPMYMMMEHTKKAMWMFHGSLYLRYNNQQLNGKTSRSDEQFDAPNWFMAMYNRPVGKNGLVSLTGMFSLDPLTVSKRGYPLLFQSGESYKGQALVDRQHPHDLFTGLTIGYTHRINPKTDLFAYFGYPGEPAISAPTFMHRVIALNDADAPLGHHWQDATHITFGAATVGVRLNNFKIEGSSFTGREPDENRYDFDAMHFDSYSFRLSYNPVRSWAFQVSRAYLNSPEILHPDEDIRRYTASALYSSPITKDGKYFAGSLVWGLNDNGHSNESSFLAEGTRQLQKQGIYSRYEFVQKSAEELDLESTFGDQVFNIHKLSIGTNRRLFSTGPIEYIAGIQTSINIPPASLQSLYGKTPVSGQIYIQLRPGLMK